MILSEEENGSIDLLQQLKASLILKLNFQLAAIYNY